MTALDHLCRERRKEVEWLRKKKWKWKEKKKVLVMMKEIVEIVARKEDE